MHINFPPVDENFIKEYVGSGYYCNETELVKDAVRRLRESCNVEKQEWLRTELDKGLVQAQNGELIPYTPGFADESLARARKNHKNGKPVKNAVKST